MRFNEYFEPQTLEEAIAIKQNYRDKAVFLAGGTDVTPKLTSKIIRPEAIIGLHRIKGISEIKVTPEGLLLGAMTCLRDIAKSSLLTEKYRVIKEAAGRVSSMQIRNVATIGGNACNASPSADAVEGLLVMNAIGKLSGKAGDRDIPLDDFFLGPGKTALQSDEILKGFFVPTPAERTGTVYIKYTVRGNIDISIVGVGVSLTFEENGTVAKARISLASVGPTPLRAKEAEAHLLHKKLELPLIREAAKIAGDNISPISDQRASAEYRREMTQLHVIQAIKDAAARAAQ